MNDDIFSHFSHCLHIFSRTVQELERPVMPTFINLPPPYSEQPSPLYNLCASSISSGSNFCEQHLRSIPFPPNNNNPPALPCCHHHHFCEGGTGNNQYETLHSTVADIGIEQDMKQDVDSSTILESDENTEQDQQNENNTDTESTSAF